MPTERKVEIVSELTDKMSRMQLAVVADYRGFTVAELTALRAKLRENGAEMIVAKNTLLRLAARSTGRENIESYLEGPTAIAFAYDDVSKVAKVLLDASKATPKPLVIRGGLLGTTPIASGDSNGFWSTRVSAASTSTGRRRRWPRPRRWSERWTAMRCPRRCATSWISCWSSSPPSGSSPTTTPGAANNPW